MKAVRQLTSRLRIDFIKFNYKNFHVEPAAFDTYQTQVATFVSDSGQITASYLVKNINYNTLTHSNILIKLY